MGKLIEDEDDRSLVCVGDTSCSDQRKVAQLVAINALHIHLVFSGGDNTNIIASNASIGTSINKSMVLNEAVLRGLMGNDVDKDLTKDVVLRLWILGVIPFGCRVERLLDLKLGEGVTNGTSEDGNFHFVAQSRSSSRDRTDLDETEDVWVFSSKVWSH